MKMRHPQIETLADTTQRAFESVWKEKGWELVDNSVALASELLGRSVKSLDDLKVEDLRGIYEIRGMATPGEGHKADFIAGLKAMDDGAPSPVPNAPVQTTTAPQTTAGQSRTAATSGATPASTSTNA